MHAAIRLTIRLFLFCDIALHEIKPMFPLLLLLLLLFRSLPRVQTVTISSGPVQDTKNLKIYPGR